MTDDELVAALADLGITRASWRAILLLPLVRTAWADGDVQGAEVETIRTFASRLGVVGPAWEVVEGWLERGPTERQARRGQQVLVALAGRHRGLGADLPDDVLSTVLRQCEVVARSAGGLFGLAFTVEPEERRVLAELARLVRRQRQAELDDLPTPDGGTWEEL